ncbi:MAG TPA: DNA recombination protein RmuC [Syntrophorhabdales bacterium]|nr:DNA recombination protein RmuC [Syntrophorhabdales bacterium]
MNWVAVVVALVAGFVLGLGSAFLLRIVQNRTARELAGELFRESESERKAHVDAIVENVKAAFGCLSLDALAKSTEEFLKLAHQRLESERELGVKELDAKKGLIDQQLQRMTNQLESVSVLMSSLEKDRVEKFGELSKHLKLAGEQTATLAQTTAMLREALASTKARGQWGERMAEDILRLAGFIESVNYVKQKAIEGIGSRPDFTFLLPKDLRLNMDVKFPLDNYMRFLEAASDMEKSRFRSDFLKDVRAKIKEVTTREYINPEQNTIDYALLFIPNEQIYAFIYEHDSMIVDESLRSKVLFVSPLTLFAVLAIIRQAVDAFALEQTSNEILSLLGSFKKQWDEFQKKFEVLGKRIEDTQKEYEALTTTRRRQLEKPLNKIEELRNQRGLPASYAPDE